MMPLGAVWNGSFWSEGLAMGLSSLLIGVSACGLTWAYLETVDEVERDTPDTEASAQA